ncbi:MAG TPA: hypothetical protein DCW90_16960 [Lachnospiraceae bacterium]|nr:glycosyltransferase [uncultured Lachnoclostridium sp.]HAU87109.1 hypothetical protein [Lachnospiraceae bacterium]
MSKQIEKDAVCTIASKNYLAQTMVMAKSIWECNMKRKVYILIADNVDDEIKLEDMEFNKNITLVTLKELHIENVNKMAFYYNLVEFNTAVKPFFMKYLLDTFHLNKLIYLDPDTMVFHDFDHTFECLETDSIVITPHVITSKKELYTDHEEFLMFGTYNLGFLGIKSGEITMAFLDWWAEKLEESCFYDPDRGLAWDQKWVNMVPAIFPKVKILKDPGYNVSYWNLQERKVEEKEKNFIVNKQYPLVFYHFSHFNIEKKGYIIDYGPGRLRVRLEDHKELIHIFDKYCKELASMNLDMYKKKTYCFNYFSNGQEIKPEFRKAFINSSQFSNIENPFVELSELDFSVQ